MTLIMTEICICTKEKQIDHGKLMGHIAIFKLSLAGTGL